MGISKGREHTSASALQIDVAAVNLHILFVEIMRNRVFRGDQCNW